MLRTRDHPGRTARKNAPTPTSANTASPDWTAETVRYADGVGICHLARRKTQAIGQVVREARMTGLLAESDQQQFRRLGRFLQALIRGKRSNIERERIEDDGFLVVRITGCKPRMCSSGRSSAEQAQGERQPAA